MTRGAAGEGTTSSGRLRVRRPTAADLDAVHRIHADLRTDVHDPSEPDPGLVRRPELEADDGTGPAVILMTHW